MGAEAVFNEYTSSDAAYVSQEEMMKKRMILTLVILSLSAGVFAESFRMGAAGGVELLNRPKYSTILKSIDNQTNLFSGLYWEVIPNHLGFGMTYLVKFDRQSSAFAQPEYEWFLDWIGSWDFRYHFLRNFPVDPFLEGGIGNAGRVDISPYGEYGLEAERDPLQLSLFGQLGGGVALRLSGFHLGAKVLYRFLNSPIPATQIETYPLKNFNVSLFGGVSF